MRDRLIHFTLCLTLFVLGCVCYELNTREAPIITVDIQRIIHQTAEGLAKANVSEDQLYQRITIFKRDLELSLTEFAAQQKALVVASHLVYGTAKDMTDAFIAYHNEQDVAPNDTTMKKKA